MPQPARGDWRFWTGLLVGLVVVGCSNREDRPEPPPAQVKPKVYSGLFPARQGGKTGYIDRTGEFKIEPKFETAERFAEGLALVAAAGRYGYIDTSGNFAIEPKYPVPRVRGLRADAYGFSEGLALLQLSGRWVYIDRTGKTVIDPPGAGFDTATDFSEGLAAVQSGGKWGYIDPAGKYVIQPRFVQAEPFREGFAAVKVSGDKWGFVDPAGKDAFGRTFDYAAGFSEGRAHVKIGNSLRASGFINRAGGTAIEPQFTGAGEFSEGLCTVGYRGSHFFVDRQGKTVITAETLGAEVSGVDKFSEGLALVTRGIDVNRKLGYVDRTGKVVIPFELDAAESFVDGIAFVKRGEKWGYIDKSGKFVWTLAD